LFMRTVNNQIPDSPSKTRDSRHETPKAAAITTFALVFGAKLLLAEPAFAEEGHPIATPSGQIAQPAQAVTDPFALDARLSGISASLTGNPEQIVRALFDRLHRGAPEGVRVMDMAGRAPRTAEDAIAQGGDCTELASIVIAVLRAHGVPGGALVVHFNGRPDSEEHMIPYAMVNGRRIIVDLQAATLGQVVLGGYTIRLTLTLDQAAEMYHREMGDYYRDSGQAAQARAAYERALAIFEGDAYVHRSLGVLYEQARNMQLASRHLARAAELDPARYGSRERRRGSYNEELQAAEQAATAGRWAECAEHLQAALDSGEPISPEDRRIIEQNRDACLGNSQR
jgi:tetratricopeptide (TPR) repeat protein